MSFGLNRYKRSKISTLKISRVRVAAADNVVD